VTQYSFEVWQEPQNGGNVNRHAGCDKRGTQ